MPILVVRDAYVLTNTMPYFCVNIGVRVLSFDTLCYVLHWQCPHKEFYSFTVISDTWIRCGIFNITIARQFKVYPFHTLIFPLYRAAVGELTFTFIASEIEACQQFQKAKWIRDFISGSPFPVVYDSVLTLSLLRYPLFMQFWRHTETNLHCFIPISACRARLVSISFRHPQEYIGVARQG